MDLILIMGFAWICLAIAWVLWADNEDEGTGDQSPVDILDRRLAEGQITVAEYKKRKQALMASDPPAV